MKYYLLLIGLFVLAISGNAQADLITASEAMPSWSSESHSGCQISGLPQRIQQHSQATDHPLIEEVIVEFQTKSGSHSILNAMGDNPELVLTERLCRWRFSKNVILAPEAISDSIALMDNVEAPQDSWGSFLSNVGRSKKSYDRLFPPRSSRRNVFLLR